MKVAPTILIVSLLLAPAVPRATDTQPDSVFAAVNALERQGRNGDAEARAAVEFMSPPEINAYMRAHGRAAAAVEAAWRLGSFYLAPPYQTYVAAARWFHMAAERGHPEAQAKLGAMYFSGNGIRKDYAEAARWSRLAARQGDSTA